MTTNGHEQPDAPPRGVAEDDAGEDEGGGEPRQHSRPGRRSARTPEDAHGDEHQHDLGVAVVLVERTGRGGGVSRPSPSSAMAALLAWAKPNQSLPRCPVTSWNTDSPPSSAPTGGAPRPPYQTSGASDHVGHEEVDAEALEQEGARGWSPPVRDDEATMVPRPAPAGSR